MLLLFYAFWLTLWAHFPGGNWHQALQIPCLLLASGLADGAGGFEAAVTRAIMLGGCNTSRASIVGAAAAAGGATVPAAWIAKVVRKDAMLSLAAELV